MTGRNVGRPADDQATNVQQAPQQTEAAVRNPGTLIVAVAATIALLIAIGVGIAILATGCTTDQNTYPGTYRPAHQPYTPLHNTSGPRTTAGKPGAPPRRSTAGGSGGRRR